MASGRHGKRGDWIPRRAGYFLAACLAAVALGVAGFTWIRAPVTSVTLGDDVPEASDAASADTSLTPMEELEGEVVVHVTGAVTSPGVFTLPAESRVEAAIEAAGGFTPDADESLLNRAEVLRDGQQVYVPREGEQPRAAVEGGGESGGTVNINTASAAELESLPGIGPALAARIVAHRETNGPFTSAEGLTAVSGIGERKLEGMIDMVTW